MRTLRAFTLVELLVVVSIIAMLVGILLPALHSARRSSQQMRNSANLRGLTQAMAIFSDSNNTYFPGLSTSGLIRTGSAVSAGNGTTGGSFHSRLWVILNGEFTSGELCLNPLDTLTKWTTGNSCTSANTSYAGLNLTDSPFVTGTTQNAGRVAEWRSNTSSRVALMSDRLVVPGATGDTLVQSVWTTTTGDWKGCVAWGDARVEFQSSNLGFNTVYRDATTTNDNLFVPRAGGGATESATNSTANAFMTYF